MPGCVSASGYILVLLCGGQGRAEAGAGAYSSKGGGGAGRCAAQRASTGAAAQPSVRCARRLAPRLSAPTPPPPPLHPYAPSLRARTPSPVDFGAWQLAQRGDAREGSLIDDEQQRHADRHDDANLHALVRTGRAGARGGVGRGTRRRRQCRALGCTPPGLPELLRPSTLQRTRKMVNRKATFHTSQSNLLIFLLGGREGTRGREGGGKLGQGSGRACHLHGPWAFSPTQLGMPAAPCKHPRSTPTVPTTGTGTLGSPAGPSHPQ